MFIPLSRFANRNLIDELYSTTQPDKQSSYLIMISSHLNLHYFCHLIFVQFPSYRCFYVKFPQVDNRYYIFLISVSKPFMCNENKCREAAGRFCVLRHSQTIHIQHSKLLLVGNHTPSC